MAYFAELDENKIVKRVIVAEQDFIDSGAVGYPKNWKETCIEGKIRKNYATVGAVYDSVNDMFVRPKPFASWALNVEKGKYEAPVKNLEETTAKAWNEKDAKWELPIKAVAEEEIIK